MQITAMKHDKIQYMPMRKTRGYGGVEGYWKCRR